MAVYINFAETADNSGFRLHDLVPVRFQLAPQDPGVKQEKPGGRAPKARGSRRRMHRGGRVWKGVSPSTTGKGLEGL